MSRILILVVILASVIAPACLVQEVKSAYLSCATNDVAASTANIIQEFLLERGFSKFKLDRSEDKDTWYALGFEKLLDGDNRYTRIHIWFEKSDAKFRIMATQGPGQLSLPAKEIHDELLKMTSILEGVCRMDRK